MGVSDGRAERQWHSSPIVGVSGDNAERREASQDVGERKGGGKRDGGWADKRDLSSPNGLLSLPVKWPKKRTHPFFDGRVRSIEFECLC